MKTKLAVIALVAFGLVSPARSANHSAQFYPKRFEYAKAAVRRQYVRCYTDGEPTTYATIDVRSKWEGGATSIFVLGLSCASCDVNEIYVVITSDSEKETRVIHVDTED